MKHLKKPLSLLLSVLITLTVFAAAPLSASAAGEPFGALTTDSDGKACYELTSGAYTLDDNYTAQGYVYVPSGVTVTINLNNKKLSRSLAAYDSAGYVIYNEGTLTLTNGTVSGGYAEEGGGICNYGTLTLDNVTVCGNRAYRRAAGIFNMNGCTLNANDLTVTGNTVDYTYNRVSGAGIYQYGSLNVSGSIKVYDNILTGSYRGANNSQDNLMLNTGKYLKINGSLNANSDIHVSTWNIPTLENPIPLLDHNGAAADLGLFVSDNVAYNITADDGGYAMLTVPGVTATFTDPESSAADYNVAVSSSDNMTIELPDAQTAGFTPPAGMAFYCWTSGGREYQPGETVTVNQNMTFTAVWKALCNVTLKSNYSDEGHVITLFEGERLPAYTEAGIEIPDGLDFAGWKVGDTVVGADYTVSSDCTAVAQWATGHVHDSVEFSAWAFGSSLPNTAGSYYLTSDVSLTAQWDVPDGEVNLCLNGHTVTQTAADQRVAYIGSDSELNLFDCGNGGKLTGGNAVYGGAVYIGENASFTMNGGTLSDNQADYGAAVYAYRNATFVLNGGKLNRNNKNDSSGVVYLFQADFEMNGGEISRNNYGNYGGVFVGNGSEFIMNGGEIGSNTNFLSNGEGGGVYVFFGGRFEMNGGCISANEADYGGGVFLDSGSLFTLTGGEIIDNTAFAEAGGVYFDDGAEFELEGCVTIIGNMVEGDPLNDDSNVHFADVAGLQTITITGELDDDTEIGVTTLVDAVDIQPVVITDGLKGCGGADNFTSDQYYDICLDAFGEAIIGEGVTISFNKGDVSATGSMTPVLWSINSQYKLPACGFAPTDGSVFVGWQVGDNTTVKKPNSLIKITGDTVITAVWICGWKSLQTMINEAEDGATITLDSGYIAHSDDAALEIPSGKTLTINLNGNDIDRDMETAAANGNVITNNGALTITGNGTVTGGKNAANGGAILNNGTLTLSDGVTISGNSTTEDGGAIYNSGELTINGATISNNSATKSGGAISAHSGTITINGGEIKNNIAGSHGGAIYLGNDGGNIAVLNLSGGTITGNSVTGASSQGGGICNNGTLNASGNPVVKNNTAPAYDKGYNIYLRGGKKVNVTGELTDGAEIGVTRANGDLGIFTSGLSGKGTADSFFSDVPDCYVGLTDNNEATLLNMGAHLEGHSISLDGDIAVNFYMQLDPELASHEGVKMQFTVPDTSAEYQNQEVAVSDDTKVGDYYVFKCRVAAKDMDSVIQAQLVYGNSKSSVYTYSVREYAKYLIENADENGTTEQKSYAKAAPLVTAMLVYGDNAAYYFDKTDTEPDEVDAEIPEYDSTVHNTMPVGVTFTGATVSLKSQTSLSLYFESDQKIELTCDGYTKETKHSGKEYVIRIRNIAVYNLNKPITVKVNGEDAVTYSPLTYCYKAQTTDNAKLVNTVKALYNYYLAAKEYFD